MLLVCILPISWYHQVYLQSLTFKHWNQQLPAMQAFEFGRVPICRKRYQCRDRELFRRWYMVVHALQLH